MTESVDLRVTTMVWRGSIKNPSESLGNTYELGRNSSCSNERNLVAGNGASTPSGTGTGGWLPTGADLHGTSSMQSQTLYLNK